MYKISQENPFKSKFFVYTDAGSWRLSQTYKINEWPDVAFINKKLMPVLHDRVLLGQVRSMLYNPGQKKLNPDSDDLIQGTFFAGTRSAMSEYYSRFFRIHDERKNKGLFMGKDQSIMNRLAFRFEDPGYKLYANAQLQPYYRFITRLVAYKQNCSLINYDAWFWYQVYFSQNASLYCNNDRMAYLTNSIE
jgi:hypothetical protein